MYNAQDTFHREIDPLIQESVCIQEVITFLDNRLENGEITPTEYVAMIHISTSGRWCPAMTDSGLASTMNLTKKAIRSLLESLKLKNLIQFSYKKDRICQSHGRRIITYWEVI